MVNVKSTQRKQFVEVMELRTMIAVPFSKVNVTIVNYVNNMMANAVSLVYRFIKNEYFSLFFSI